ncbi:AraC family transcriptional regulator [Pedobacter sp. BMA]|uniref:helix-turn-helix domain-containing protein n=1 Tax=Pedobacter sp. BMA TaxID=1663685 RepID=UPI000649B763|nr:AraC family transcriptional regulator [Pedobacter sp. BMA]KLT64702.1 hypothetical protein AB669_13175 [Pedobacter sp. BMA]
MSTERHVAEHDLSKPHRDDHYLIMVAIGGDFIIDIDFEKNVVTAPAILLINPGQIHHIISTNKPEGWAMSIDPALIDLEFQSILEKGFNRPLILEPASAFYNHTVVLLEQMEKMQAAITNPFQMHISHSMLNALVGLIAGEVMAADPAGKTKANRATLIEQAFTELLKKHYKDWKQPAKYAAALNISVAHLYDTVKSITGDSVSAQIQQYGMLEAKRLLCFTKYTVREIAYQLGYEEPVYFGKLFKKITGFTPLQFRQKYHD